MEYHGPRARKRHAAEIAESEAASQAEATENEPGGQPAAHHQTLDQPVPLPPRTPREVDPTKDLIWALALGFGAAACGFFEVPRLLYPIPLGLGLAGGILCVVALFRPGGQAPWYSWLALAASIAGIALGGTAYSEYKDVEDELSEAQKQLEGLENQTVP